jgi:hypothetical protein
VASKKSKQEQPKDPPPGTGDPTPKEDEPGPVDAKAETKKEKRAQRKQARKEKREDRRDEGRDDDATDGEPEETDEDDVVYTTRWYWTSFILSLIALALGLLYIDPTLPVFFVWGFYFVIVVSAFLVLYSLVGLVRRYRLIHGVRHRSGQLARRSGTALRQLKPERGEKRERKRRAPSFGWAGKVVGKVVRFAVAVFQFLYRFLVRLVYFVEWLVVWVIILTYDIIYYVLYAAWWLAYKVGRIAWKVLYFLLRVAWRILRLPTRVPPFKKLWAQKMRPPILAKWHKMVEGNRQKWAKRVERRKRVVAAKGHDPEVWQQERVEHYWFPLPLPHAAKDALKKRLGHAAKTKDERVARGHPFATPEERDRRRVEKEKAKEEKQKAKQDTLDAKEQVKAEKERAKLEAKKAKKAEAKAHKEDEADAEE